MECISIRSNDVCLQPPDTKASILDACSITETIFMQIFYLLTEALRGLVLRQTVQAQELFFQYNSMIFNSQGNYTLINVHHKCHLFSFYSQFISIDKGSGFRKRCQKCYTPQNANEQLMTCECFPLISY